LVLTGTTDSQEGDFYIEYDPSDGKFYDAGDNNPGAWGIDTNGTNLSAFPTAANMQTQYWYNAGGSLIFLFDSPYYVEPPPEPDEPVERIVFTDGGWTGSYDYLYFETTPEGRFLYGLVSKDTTNRLNGNNIWDVEYDPSDGIFYDVGDNAPYTWTIDNTGTNLTAFPTSANMQTQYWYNASDNLECSFTNPYYVAPEPEPVDEPDESKKRLVATGGQWNGSFEYLYFENTPEGNYLYGLVETDSSDRYSPTNYDFEYNPSDGKFYDSGSSHPAKWGIDYNGNGISEFPTTANMETLFWYDDSADTLIFQFDNPFYVAPPPPPEPVARLVATGGSWEDIFDWLYFGTTSDGRFLYGMVNKGTTSRHSNSDQCDFEYDPSDKKFHDKGPDVPKKWVTDANGNGISDFPTFPNIRKLIISIMMQVTLLTFNLTIRIMLHKIKIK